MAAISPTRMEDYPAWYQQVITEAELAENSSTRGSMVIKPWGYGIWQRIQMLFDQQLVILGYENAYFPLLIPLKHLEKEAEHVQGFAKECAVVTHHRLVEDEEGGLKPDGKLEEPFVIRPTSETIIGESMAKWVQSYRDLPLRINQWANVMRWEMRTRMFLRTSEFLWQEAHAAYATADQADKEAREALVAYKAFAEGVLAMPVIAGEKTVDERFPGATNTYCIEAMMQDGKALQAGTSHFLGQSFAKAADIRFSDEQGEHQHVWTTSFGMSTRLIGGLIMTHSDDDGLVLPPKVAPKQAVILPIYRTDEEKQSVLAACHDLKAKIEAVVWDGEPVRVLVDDRDMRGGDKTWQWVKKGIPLRIEIGPRDLAAKSAVIKRRDQGVKEKVVLDWQACVDAIADVFTQMQQGLLSQAQSRMEAHITDVDSLEAFEAFFAKSTGFVRCFAVDSESILPKLKALNVSARCMPWEDNDQEGTCIFTGKKVLRKIVFAKAY